MRLPYFMMWWEITLQLKLYWLLYPLLFSSNNKYDDKQVWLVDGNLVQMEGCAVWPKWLCCIIWHGKPCPQVLVFMFSAVSEVNCTYQGSWLTKWQWVIFENYANVWSNMRDMTVKTAVFLHKRCLVYWCDILTNISLKTARNQFSHIITHTSVHPWYMYIRVRFAHSGITTPRNPVTMPDSPWRVNEIEGWP